VKNLIIVESPAKAKTIKNFLGKDFTVIASKGHIRDLPKHNFGIKEKDGLLEPQYETSADHKQIAAELKKLASEADTTYLATDEDREGEAIAFHIAHEIGKDPEKLPRIVFHEITKTAIEHSLKNPRLLNMDMVNAQQARRLLDRIVGYKLSPLLGSKIQRGLSAGRVQSSALKIIVDREREIKEFKPQRYFEISAVFKKAIKTELYEFEGKKTQKLSIGDDETAQKIVALAKSEKFIVNNIETKKTKSSSPAPFMTSTLQQGASTKLGFSPKKTMSVAQKLYEGVATHTGVSGVITYMRTDSLNIAKEAQELARDYITAKYGKEYLPATAKQYKTKNSSAQEAHEAIRPTMLDFTPEVAAQYLKGDELRLYKLIFERFIASQMKDAEFEVQNVFFGSKSLVFKANGKKILFDGYCRVAGVDEKDTILPAIKEKSDAQIEEVDAKEKFTEPPARYSEASLIKQMEALGIGRPSTYAPTVSLLVDREYIELQNKQIIAAEIGFKVIEMLEEHFANIVDASFTAKMEEELDEVADNKKDWQKLLRGFYDSFMEQVNKGKKDIVSQKIAVPIDEACPTCGKELIRRSGRFGEFIACSAYPKCKYSRNLGGVAKEAPKESDEKCDKCGLPMVIKNGRNGEFLACTGYPKCKSTKTFGPQKTTGIKCPACQEGEIIQKKGKTKFFGCTAYPKCTFATRYEPSVVPCEKCGFATTHKKLKTKEYYECLNDKCKHKSESVPRSESEPEKESAE
jgi:DNA topoisomerase I